MNSIKHEELDKKSTEELCAFSDAVLESISEMLPKDTQYSKLNLLINVLTICLVKIGYGAMTAEYRQKYAEGIYQNLIRNFENLKVK